MKKCFAITLVIILLAIVYIVIHKKIQPIEFITVKVSYLMESTVDVSSMDSLYDTYFAVRDTEFTCWEQYYDMEQLKEAIKTYGLPPVAVNYDTQSCIISFGRKIADIKYLNSQNNPFHGYMAEVTFEEQYHGYIVYVYTIDKIGFVPSAIALNPVYKMIGNKRVLWGNLFDINTQSITQ